MRKRKLIRRYKSLAQRAVEALERLSPPINKPRFTARHGKWKRRRKPF